MANTDINSQEYLEKLDAYWRAANYLAAAQLYISAFFEEHPAKQEATTATAIATANILLTIFIKKTSIHAFT